ncbi:MAG: phosphotransferase [Alicyclobacillus sp.]|nr:phosphotransferase [Alicyclobacillus sp.]
MQPGTELSGRWSGIRLVVEACLGRGANGAVYLVRTSSGRAALKVCNTSADAALEWAVLTEVHGAGVDAFPKPIAMDDGPTEAPFFYVMEWIDGISLRRVAERGQWSVLQAAVAHIVETLTALHGVGKAFCDVKPENILVTAPDGHRVRFVDVGGVTPFGRSVRQFTPQTDRAYFGLGSRKAEPAYDLFALVLALLSLRAGSPPADLVAADTEARRRWLTRELSRFPIPSARTVMAQVLDGRITDMRAFRAAWLCLPPQPVHRRQSPSRKGGGTANAVPHQPAGPNRTAAAPHSRGNASARTRKLRSSQWDWTEWLMWLTVASAVGVSVVAWLIVLQ